MRIRRRRRARASEPRRHDERIEEHLRLFGGHLIGDRVRLDGGADPDAYSTACWYVPMEGGSPRLCIEEWCHSPSFGPEPVVISSVTLATDECQALDRWLSSPS